MLLYTAEANPSPTELLTSQVDDREGTSEQVQGSSFISVVWQDERFGFS